MSLKRGFVTVVMMVTLGIALTTATSTAASTIIEGDRTSAAATQATVTLNAVADATVKSWQPDTNFGGDDYLELSYETIEYTGYEAVTLVRFDLSSLPSDAVIDSAFLRLFLNGGSGASPVTIAAYFITSSWDENTITWNTYLTTGQWGLNASIDATGGSYKSWHVTSFAQSWVDDPSSNHGVMLRGPTDGTYYERWFESRDHMEMVPQLEVTYHRQPYSFSGHVYEGEPEDTSTPQSGVTVELWGDEDEWPEGGAERVRLATTETDGTGAFTLEWEPDFDWPVLHVIEVDPPEAISTGARAELPGNFRNYNVIFYRRDDMLETGEHDFGGIAFWDRFPEELPDLIVTDLWPEGHSVCTQIQNIGAGVAPAGHQAALFVDGAQQSTLSVGADLGPMETWDGCFDYTWDCTGESDDVEVRADATGFVAEHNETNNSRAETWECEAPPPYTFSGHVYEGEPEDTSAPLPEVVVELWGDEDELPESGFERVLLATTATSGNGAFTLEWLPDTVWPYLHVIEVDPPGMESTGAQADAPGTVESWNVISYRHDDMLETGLHDFGGIAFWDRFPEAFPDLIVSDIWPEGGIICYRAENVGSAVAPGGHQSALFVDGGQQSTDAVGIDLAPTEAWEGCFEYAWDCTGEADTVKVHADAADAVVESNEANNAREEIWECDTGPLRIVSGPTVSGLTQSSAVISWETNKAADSVVRYDAFARLYGLEQADPVRTTEHQVTLVGLTPSTTYHFVVRSTDAAANSVESRDRIFETLAGPDDRDPTVRILDPGVVSGTVRIEADADDDKGVEKVEFYLDDELVFTDYWPPYEWEFDSDGVENGDYKLEAKAVDLSGRTILDQLTIPIFNFIDTEAPQVHIFHPANGANVYGDTRVWVTVSDDSGWSEVEWFVDGKKQEGGSFPVSPSLDMMFWWDTRFFSQGSHSLGVQATDSDNKVGSDVIVVNVANAGPAAHPKLVVTKHEAFRHAHAFAVELTVENKGQATATDIEIVDPLTAFQPISRTFNGVGYEISLNATAMRADATIKDPSSLAAGGSRKYIIAAVPVLVHDKPPVPSIGSAIKLSYADPYGSKYSESAKFEILKTTATAGSAPSEPIKTAYDNALKEADYLIVTNPSFLSFHNPFQDEDEVLSQMARLAFDRDGVLGYLRTSNRTTLGNLVEATGDWGKRLDGDFRTAAKGYLLIVGETEIIPGWRESVGPVTWSNSACTTREADLSDLPYADTGGSDARPELIVGRIIGNDAADLSAAIKTSLSGSFDRSHALLVSGTDGTASIQKLFTGSVDEIEKVIKSEFTVTKHHWKDITASNRVTQFKNNTSGKDVVLYQGHGGPDSWSDLGTNDVLGNPTSTPPTPGVSFGSTNPVVFGWACLTGSYESHVANSPCTHGGGDDNLAEAFFDQGAAVYIGATEVSPINQNRAAAKAMFQKWWKPNVTIGKALTDLKRDMWSGNGYVQLFEYEYNLYGDPKYGAAPAGSSSAQTAPVGERAMIGPLASVDIVVPDYEVTDNDGYDEVEIPGGGVLLDEGEYRIPYYYRVLEYSPGYEVQNVTLTDRSGMVTDSGLNLPINERVTTSAFGEQAVAPEAAGSWIPEEQYSWSVTEDPDGTITLMIVMYAFTYNPDTTDVEFFKNYSFDIDYTVSPVTITHMATKKDEYVQGETVVAEIWLENTGGAQDVSVSAVVKAYPTGEPAAGLKLETLDGLTGAASFTAEWDTAGFDPGAYTVEVTLMDAQNQILDGETQVFQLGVVSCALTSFEVSPLYFDVGQTISASMVFENTGSVALDGTSVIEVQGAGGAVVEEYQQSFSALAPSAEITFDAAWDTTEAADGTYSVLGYVMYDGGASEPALATVSTGQPQSHVFLPLVLRRHP